MHYTRKTLHNNSQEYAGQHLSTDFFRTHSNIERCLKNLELLNEPLNKKLIDFDKEKQNFYDKCDVSKNDRENIQVLLTKNRTNLDSHESRTSQGQQIIRDLHSEVMQIKSISCATKLHQSS